MNLKWNGGCYFLALVFPDLIITEYYKNNTTLFVTEKNIDHNGFSIVIFHLEFFGQRLMINEGTRTADKNEKSEF